MTASPTAAMLVFCGLVGATAVVSVNELIDLDDFRPMPPPEATALLPDVELPAMEDEAAEPVVPEPDPEAPPSPVADASESPAEPEVAVAVPDPVQEAPAPVAEATDPIDDPSEAADDRVPQFDLLRAEPDGSLVIAGNGPAGAEMEIIAGTETVARAQAGPTGDFAAVLDEPLPPGDYQIVLRATGPDGVVVTSRQTAVVAIPEAGSREVLALVEEPGTPSRLITTPEPEATALIPVEPEMPAPVETPQATLAEPEPVETARLPEPEAIDAPPTPEPETPAVAEAPQTETAVPETETPQIAALPSEPEPERQTVEPAPLDLRIEAVEIDGIEVFVAGAATAGTRILVYANEILLGDTLASEVGRFLVQARRDLPVGDYIIRADAIDPATAQVLKRASVPFERSAGERLAAVAAPREDAQPIIDEPAETPVSVEEPPTLIEPGLAERAEPSTGQAVDAPEAPAAPKVETARAPETAEPEPEAGGPQVAARPEAPVAADPQNAVPEEAGVSAAPEPSPADPAPPASQQAPAPAATVMPDEQVVDIAPETSAPALPPDDEQIATADPVPDEPQTASTEPDVEIAPPAANAPQPVIETRAAAMVPVDESVIIRRGDTLWQISRRVYGRGVKYTTIYLANQDQITDPGRIWPGQVFDVPTEADEDAEATHRQLRRQRR